MEEEVGVWIGQEIKVGGKQQRILQSRVPSTDSGGVKGWRGGGVGGEGVRVGVCGKGRGGGV